MASLWKAVQSELRNLLAPAFVRLLLAALLAVDIALLAMHAAQVHAGYYGTARAAALSNFDMDRDGNHVELFEYLLNALTVAMLASCWWRTRQPMFLALCVVLLFTLADNGLRLHEGFGALLAPSLQAAARIVAMAPIALGELLFYLLCGPALLLMLAFATSRSGEENRARGAIFLLLLMALGGFGAGVDFVHSMLLDAGQPGGWTMMGGPLDKILGFVEDGGELLVLTAICALSCALNAVPLHPALPHAHRSS